VDPGDLYQRIDIEHGLELKEAAEMATREASSGAAIIPLPAVISVPYLFL